MPERISRFFRRDWSGIHEAAIVLGGFAFLSQILGLFRDRLLAAQFGASGALDIYYAAFRIPDFLYASIASLAAVATIVPLLAEKLEEDKNGDRARRFMSDMTTAFTFLLLIVAAATWVLMPYLVPFVVPGIDASSRVEVIQLSRLLLLSPIFLGISNLFGALAQAFRRFAIFAFAPVAYNGFILASVLFLAPVWGIRGVVWGVVFGAMAHLLLQVPVLLEHGFIPRFTTVTSFADVRRVVVHSLPRTSALAMLHVTATTLVALASTVGAGAIAIFSLALNLQSVPLSIVGMSYSVAAFPTLARKWAARETEAFGEEVATAVRHILFWSVPAAVLFVVLRAQIVRAALGSGVFDWTATRLVAASLALFALSVWAQSLIHLFARTYYAMGETKVPLLANIFGSCISITATISLLAILRGHGTMLVWLETLLRVDGIPGTVVLALPLGYSIGSIANVMVYMVALRRRLPKLFSSVRRGALQVAASSIVAGYVAYHGLALFAGLGRADTFIAVLGQGFFAGTLGIIAGIFLLSLMDNKELREIHRSLLMRIRKVDTLAEESENLL